MHSKLIVFICARVYIEWNESASCYLFLFHYSFRTIVFSLYLLIFECVKRNWNALISPVLLCFSIAIKLKWTIWICVRFFQITLSKMFYFFLNFSLHWTRDFKLLLLFFFFFFLFVSWSKLLKSHKTYYFILLAYK